MRKVKKGLREKAEQGHWPTKAPLGYVDNLATHRIEVDPVRRPLLTTLFDLYASGQYSLKALTAKAHEVGLTHTKETAVERTFVQFYPTLLEVARRKGTAKPGF